MPAQKLTWTCQCGAENWNTRSKCRSCKTVSAPNWNRWETERRGNRRRDWRKGAREQAPPEEK
eukprot:14363721-Alexandrium_andersonii.AAC.1